MICPFAVQILEAGVHNFQIIESVAPMNIFHHISSSAIFWSNEGEEPHLSVQKFLFICWYFYIIFYVNHSWQVGFYNEYP